MGKEADFLKKFVTFLLLAAFLILPASAASEKQEEEVRLPIVMYHHLSPKARLQGDYVLSPDELESDLQYLQEHGYESITTEQLIQWSKGEAELPEKPVMITFDDGYESTLVYGGPLLEKYGFQAVIAVIGSAADLFTEKRDHMLDYSYLAWDAVQEISHNDVFEIQCHTYTMHKLNTRKGCGKITGEDYSNYKTKLAEDLTRFRDKCAAENVHLVNAIAFPYGVYCDDTISIIKELGFEAAFTCTERINYLKRDPDELFELRRFNRPHGISSERFFSKWED
jgi:peptidoglycan/xylan/chitin deacetylase (PgdA/CDA1 family)